MKIPPGITKEPAMDWHATGKWDRKRTQWAYILARIYGRPTPSYRRLSLLGRIERQLQNWWSLVMGVLVSSQQWHCLFRRIGVGGFIGRFLGVEKYCSCSLQLKSSESINHSGSSKKIVN
jgi:hypothetical protein